MYKKNYLDMDIESELKLCTTRQQAFDLLEHISAPQLQLLGHALHVAKPHRGGRLAMIEAIINQTVGARLISNVIRGT